LYRSITIQENRADNGQEVTTVLFDSEMWRGRIERADAC